MKPIHTLFAFFAFTNLTHAQQVLDQSQVIASGQESQMLGALRKDHQVRGYPLQVVTSERSAVQLWNGWNLNAFQKQYAVQLSYNPVLKKAHVKLGSRVSGDASAWSVLITTSFQNREYVRGVQTLLEGLKVRNPLPAPQSNYVTDFAGVLDAQTRKTLNHHLAQMEKQTNLEGTVVVLPSLKTYGAQTVESFALDLFNRWGVGDPRWNRGFMLLVSMEDRKIRIQLGKGYGTALNASTKALIQNTIAPNFKAGRYQRGIQDGTLQLIQLVKRHVNRVVPTQSFGGSQTANLSTDRPQNSPSMSWWEMQVWNFRNFMNELEQVTGGINWWILVPILFPLLAIVIGIIVVVSVMRSALRGGPLPPSRRSGFRHSHHHHHHGHSGAYDDDEARRAFMAGAAASTVTSTWDSSSSSLDSSSSSSDSFSGGSSDSSSGSSGDW
ncbi:TPM domain-containing protein [Deinococcus cellulosilyticus]|uniref:TPM domain-containing protein n=1 Tax=Deinococcus cellulosilyticus (strain DSM 18568 / NBRC 106333 / KACC 11606 / 5516J-15) TaxID=1223518 RepID=A0A511N8A2_DEIC1|nr:TPM domain-containing protein [Deinococcus cellulosilyticus]GEM49063.1 hypothetical protein DC3_46980 [Deinococcus cellulosilyticus NBRC 106333 = KACC 11606]